MATPTPLKATFSGSDPDGLAEFESGDTLPVATIPNVPIAANAQTGTTYTLAAGDAGKEVQCSNASAITVTVDASAFTAGDYVLVRQTGAGQVTLAAASGTTITKGGPTLKTAQQGSLMYVRAQSSSTAYAGGEVAAS